MRYLPSVVITGVLLAAGTSAMAVPTVPPARAELPAGSTSCDFDAWTSFRASEPVDIRAQPNANAKILGSLPVSTNPTDEVGSIEFVVVEARPGWLRIDRVSDPGGEDAKGTPLPLRDVYQGTGWIPANAAQIGIQSALGYARPDAGSPIILDLDDDWLTDMGDLQAIRACAGPWLLLDYHLRRERRPSGALIDIPDTENRTGTAWFRGICANQYTTCDMKSVDQRK